MNDLADQLLPVPDVTGQLCPGCGRTFSFSELALAPVVTGGPKFPMCPGCREQAKADFGSMRGQQFEEKRSRAAVKRVERFVELARDKGERAAPTIHRTLTALLDEAGGIEKFVAIWWGQIEAAIEDKPGSRTVLDSFLRIANLLNQATPRLESSVTQFADMTDDQLMARQRMAIERLFILKLADAHPEFLPALEDYMQQQVREIEAADPLEPEEEEEDEEEYADAD